MSEKVYDLNMATEEELIALPGMTKTLVERIQEGRPYASIDDLKNVKGVGSKLIGKWQSSLYINGQPESDQSIETSHLGDEEILPQEDLASDGLKTGANIIPESQAGEAKTTEPAESVIEGMPAMIEDHGQGREAVPADVPPQEMNGVKASDEPKRSSVHSPRYITQFQAVLLVLISSGMSFIMAVIFTLILLIVLNGGVMYAPSNAVNQLQMDIQGITDEIDLLQSDLLTVDAKLNRVDRLSEQVSGVENQIAEVQSTVNAAQRTVASLREEMDAITEDVVNLGARTQVFEQFLFDLRKLLDGVNGP